MHNGNALVMKHSLEVASAGKEQRNGVLQGVLQINAAHTKDKR